MFRFQIVKLRIQANTCSRMWNGKPARQLRTKTDLKTLTAVKKREALTEGQLTLKRLPDGTSATSAPTSFKLGADVVSCLRCTKHCFLWKNSCSDADTERQTDRDTERETDKDTQTDTERKTNRQIETQRHRQTETDRHRQTDRDRHTERESTIYL